MYPLAKPVCGEFSRVSPRGWDRILRGRIAPVCLCPERGNESAADRLGTALHLAHRKSLISLKLFGGEGGIRTHVPVTRQHAFEARPLRPLRYLSARVL